MKYGSDLNWEWVYRWHRLAKGQLRTVSLRMNGILIVVFSFFVAFITCEYNKSIACEDKLLPLRLTDSEN